MSGLPLIFAAHKRTGFSEAVTVNCLVEADPTNPSQPLALIARPGLEAFEQVGNAPRRGVFQKQGIFDGEALILMDDTLWRLSESGTAVAFSGTVAGDGLVVMDGGLDEDSESVVRIATGTAMYIVQGTAVLPEDFPDSGNAGATSVTYLGGYWIGTETGTDFAYYIEPVGVTWTPLEFAAAEYKPDKLKGAVTVGEIAWLLGEASLEGWRATGDASSQLEPAGGLKFDIGCRSLYAVSNVKGTLIFVDDTCQVRLTSGGEPVIISGHGLAEQIRRVSAASLRASWFIIDGHLVWVLYLGTTATWLYDLTSKAWTRADSQGYDYWRADNFCTVGDTVLATDALSNEVYRVDPDVLGDDGDTFTMSFAAYIEAKERAVPLANLELHCHVGGSPMTGQGSDPLVVMKMSGDAGKTYGDPEEAGLGGTGDYLQRVRWNALGTAFPPFGTWFQFFISDPVVRRVSGGAVNVP